jgi:hypothetical protein
LALIRTVKPSIDDSWTWAWSLRFPTHILAPLHSSVIWHRKKSELSFSLFDSVLSKVDGIDSELRKKRGCSEAFISWDKLVGNA